MPASPGPDPTAPDVAGVVPHPDLPDSPQPADATSIRLSALEERVRLLESGASRLPVLPAAGSDPDLTSSRSTRGLIATRLAALGHPSRLELLAGVVRGAGTTSQLAAELGTGSTGQLYHHLNQLVAAGWLRTTGRGRYEIPPDRQQALSTVLALVGTD